MQRTGVVVMLIFSILKMLDDVSMVVIAGG